ncbi:MAG: TraR/DksA family transcriptional regulator [Bacteroidales bacterium]|jgi:DnaK suppressor protein
MTDPKKVKLEAPEKLRYSDEELEEFKAIILAKLDKSKEDLKMLMETFHLDGEHGTDDTSPTFKILEEGYQVMSKEENSRLAARQQKFINNLENALLRIENKTYGICRATGKLISKDRLKSVPHATLSIEAKRNQHLRT